MIKIILDNGSVYHINLEETKLKAKILKSLKHLQHVKLPYSLYDNTILYSFDAAFQQLKSYAEKLKIKLDLSKVKDQLYLNQLHQIYEKNYSNNQCENDNWLYFHEAIHIIERVLYKKNTKSLSFDYRHFGGRLSTNFSFDELDNFTLINRPGDCIICFNELGKTPFDYWKDNEPDNLSRFCELAKPFIRFNFSIKIYFEDHDISNYCEINDFFAWFSKYKDSWCKHWNLPDWSLEQSCGNIKIGHCNDWKKMHDEVFNGAKPVYLKLL